jgi:hypothetical protein
MKLTKIVNYSVYTPPSCRMSHKRAVAKERTPKAPLQWAAKKSAPPAAVAKDREESSDNEPVPEDDFEDESESEVEDGAPDSGEEGEESDSDEEEVSEV